MPSLRAGEADLIIPYAAFARDISVTLLLVSKLNWRMEQSRHSRLGLLDLAAEACPCHSLPGEVGCRRVFLDIGTHGVIRCEVRKIHDNNWLLYN